MYMISHRAGDADISWRAFRLKSNDYIYCVPVKVSSIGNRVANIDPDAEADGPVGRLVAITVGHLSLHVHCTAHRSVYAVEDNQQRIAPGLDDFPTMLLYRWVDDLPAERTQSVQSSGVVQPNQTAVANHIRIDHSDQLSPIWRTSDQV